MLIGATVAVLGLAVALAASGASLGWCLVVAMLAPAVTVVVTEIVGDRPVDAAVEGEAP